MVVIDIISDSLCLGCLGPVVSFQTIKVGMTFVHHERVESNYICRSLSLSLNSNVNASPLSLSLLARSAFGLRKCQYLFRAGRMDGSLRFRKFEQRGIDL